MLVVVDRVVAGTKTRWLCRCDCGGEITLTGHQFSYGAYRSCGCLSGQKHKWSRTPTYRSWKAMRNRCTKSYATGFENYGGRGITVCERWSRFVNFLDDMGVRPDGTSLDRIDTNGNYEPRNCRWADRKTQKENQRTSLVRIDSQVSAAIERISSSRSPAYSKAEVLEMLRELRTDLIGTAMP